MSPSRVEDAGFAARLRVAVRLLGLALAAACVGIGPSSVPRDRSEYSAAIGESWKRQALLNVVKLRYLDTPIFLDVGQIVSGYTLSTAVSAGADIDLGSDADIASVGAATAYTDRPTIASMLQAGYAADLTLTWCVDAFNGLRNRPAMAGAARAAEPDFLKAVELMRDIQTERGFSLSIRKDAERETTVLVFHGDQLPPEMRVQGEQLRVLLGLPADLKEAVVVASTGRVAVAQSSPVEPPRVLTIPTG